MRLFRVASQANAAIALYEQRSYCLAWNALTFCESTLLVNGLEKALRT